MTKFEYSKNSNVSLEDAKRSRNVVYAVRGTIGVAAAAAVWALVALTPVWLWLGLGIGCAILGCLYIVGEYGDGIVDWYDDHKRAYHRAKRSGVRDE